MCSRSVRFWTSPLTSTCWSTMRLTSDITLHNGTNSVTTNCPVLHVTGTCSNGVGLLRLWSFHLLILWGTTWQETRTEWPSFDERNSGQVSEFKISGSLRWWPLTWRISSVLMTTVSSLNLIWLRSLYQTTSRFNVHLRSKDRLLTGSTSPLHYLPSVSICYAFFEYLKTTRFTPLVVTGDSKNDQLISTNILRRMRTVLRFSQNSNVLGVLSKLIPSSIIEGSSIEFWHSSRSEVVLLTTIGSDWLRSPTLFGITSSDICASCDTTPEVSEYDLLDYVNVSEWSDGLLHLHKNRFWRFWVRTLVTLSVWYLVS